MQPNHRSTFTIIRSSTPGEVITELSKYFATSTSKGGSHVNVLTSNLCQTVPTRPKAQKTETCTLNSMAVRARPSGHHAEAEIDPDPSQGPHSAQNGHKPKGLPRWPLAASPPQGRQGKHPRTAGRAALGPDPRSQSIGRNAISTRPYLEASFGRLLLPSFAAWPSLSLPLPFLTYSAFGL